LVSDRLHLKVVHVLGPGKFPDERIALSSVHPRGCIDIPVSVIRGIDAGGEVDFRAYVEIRFPNRRPAAENSHGRPNDLRTDRARAAWPARSHLDIGVWSRRGTRPRRAFAPALEQGQFSFDSAQNDVGELAERKPRWRRASYSSLPDLIRQSMRRESVAFAEVAFTNGSSAWMPGSSPGMTG
jgi:hypothetical protein